MKKILIAGGSGLVGQHLTKHFLEKGYQVGILTRNKKKVEQDHDEKKERYFYWDTNQRYIDEEAIKFSDAVVNLSGENVATKKWTKKRKAVIVSSRVNSGEVLSQSINTIPNNIKHFVQASAIGWYGDGDNIFQEDSQNATDFLGKACYKWENSVQGIKNNSSVNISILRIGIVLSTKGGFFSVFKHMVFKLPVVAIFDAGKQIVSWIHIEDLCRMIAFSLEHSLNGTYNAVSPEPFTNKAFLKVLIKYTSRFKIFINLPKIFLKIFLGEMSVEILKSCFVSSEKIQDIGFRFQYTDIHSAIQNLLKKP